MIKRAKQMIGNIVAASLTLLIFSSWFVLPAETEASVSYIDGVNEPSNGAGRVICAEIATEAVETSIDIPETETPENEPYIASQAVVETESETETYPNLPEPTEYYQILPNPDPIIETDIDALIVQIAGEYGLPWELVRAVVWAESTFNVYALSDTYDYGLMQVSYIVWNGLDPSLDRYDPETNLRVGCDVLKKKIDANGGDIANGLTCYRFGDGGALEKWRQGEYSNWYNERVLGKYYEYLRGEN